MKHLIAILIIISIGCKSNDALVSNHTSVYQTNHFPIKYGELWGYADYLGNTIIEPQFEEASLFHYGIAAVKKDNLYGYISHTGNWIVKPKYTIAETFLPRFYGKRDKEGNAEKELIAKVSEGNGHYYITSDGKPIKEVTLSNARGGCVQFLPKLDEYSIRNLDGTYELIYSYLKIESDTSSYKVEDTTNLKLDTIIELDNHFALLKKDSKYAIYYTDLSRGFDAIKKERMMVTHDSTYTFSNPEFIFDDVKFRSINGELKPSAIYKKDGRWGIIHSGDKEIVPFIYLDIIQEQFGRSYLVEFEENKYGYISILYEPKEVRQARDNNTVSYVVREHFKRLSANKTP